MILTDNFDRLCKEAASEKENGSLYRNSGNVRNLCFTWTNGIQKFLNYAYLQGCEYSPEENMIIMRYSFCEITLKGRNLEGLFVQLQANLVKEIIAEDERYLLSNEPKVAVFEIIIV